MDAAQAELCHGEGRTELLFATGLRAPVADAELYAAHLNEFYWEVV
jgi:hypothetical protein